MNLKITLSTTLSIIVLAGIGAWHTTTHAQSYTLETNSNVTFTSIVDTGTVLGLAHGDNDAGVFEAVTIPFEFDFFGERITTLVPTTNLFLSTNPNFRCIQPSRSVLGNCLHSGVSQFDRLEPIDSDDASRNHQGGIYPFWIYSYLAPDRQESVFHQTTGGAGNRILTIEYSDFTLTGTTNQRALSLQVKLFEEDNSISFLYSVGSVFNLQLSSVGAVIGLAASGRFFTNPFRSTSRYYTLSAATSAPDLNEELDTITPTSRPANNQEYRFIPNTGGFPDLRDIEAITNESISYVLPEPFNRTGTTTYIISGLPSGYALGGTNQRTLLGRSSSTHSARTVTYTAVDRRDPLNLTDDITSTGTFTFSVVDKDDNPDTSPSFTYSGTTLQSRTVVSGSPVPASQMQLDTAVGGNGPITYTWAPHPPINNLSNLIPRGLMLQPYNATIIGTTTHGISDQRITVTATDLDGDTATIDYLVSVVQDLKPRYASDADEIYHLNFGSSVNGLEFPGLQTQGNLNVPPSRYTPLNTRSDNRNNSNSWLMLSNDGMGHQFSGMAPAGSEDTIGDDSEQISVTRTITDVDGDSTSVTYTFNLVDSRPIAPDPISPITITVGEPFTDIDLGTFANTAEGLAAPNGNAIPLCTPTLSLTPALPLGLTFSTSTRNEEGFTRDFGEIAGPPTVTTGPDSVGERTYTYTNTCGPDVVETTFTITVEDSQPTFPVGTAEIIDRRFEVGDALSIVLPAVVGGSGAITYSIVATPTPGWLTIDQTARTLRGTAEATGNTPINVVYTITDVDGDTLERSFVISVENDTQPSIDDASFASTFFDTGVFTFNPGQAVNELLPMVTGGNAPFTHTLAVANAANSPIITLTNSGNLTFNSGTRRISGDLPNDTASDDSIDAVEYIYTVTDVDGDDDTFRFTIRVVDYRAVATDIPDYHFTVSQLIAPITLPPFTEYPDEFFYGLSGLPDGLVFAPSTRMLTGTPSRVQNSTATYTVNERNGNTVDNTTVTINIRILLDAVPIPPTIENFEFNPGDVVDISLPNFEGGDLPFGYLLSADGTTVTSTTTLVGGLTYNPQTRRITGTVGGDDDSSTFTYSATDNDDTEPDFRLTTFDITIVDNTPQRPSATFNIPGSLMLMVGEPVPRVRNTGVSTVILPEFTGGDGELRYFLQGRQLPPGLSLDPITREITGTATGFHSSSGTGTNIDDPALVEALGRATRATTDHTLQARDADGDSPLQGTGFSITLIDLMPTAPTELNLTTTTFQVGEDRSRNYGRQPDGHSQRNAPQPTIFSGGSGALRYSISPAIPGLTFNSRGVLSGAVDTGTDNIDDTTCQAGKPPGTQHTITATDFDGDTDSFMLIVCLQDSLPIAPEGDLRFDFQVGSNSHITAAQRTLPKFTVEEGLEGFETFYYLRDNTDTHDLPPFIQEPEVSRLNPTLDTRILRLLGGSVTIPVPDDVTHIDYPVDAPDLDFEHYSYTATDGDGDTATKEFTIRLIDPRPVDNPNALTLEFTVGQSMDTPLPAASGGNRPLMYSAITPTLPPSLQFDPNPDSRRITGIVDGTTSNDDMGTITYTYTATDFDGDSAITSFTIRVFDPAPVAPGSTQRFRYTVGSSDVPVMETLAEFDQRLGADVANFVYALDSTPALPYFDEPEEWSFDPLTREITGTLPADVPGDQSFEATAYTYTATEGESTDQDSASHRFTITITDDIPVAPTMTQDFTFEAGVEKSVTLEPFTGGTGALTHALVLAEGTSLPAGLRFDPASNTIRGTVPDRAGDDKIPANEGDAAPTFTYTATDTVGDTPSSNATFTIAVTDSLPAFSQSTASVTYFVNQTQTFRLPTATGGNAPLTYMVASATPLPPGITLQTPPDNLALTGAPEGDDDRTVSIIATDAGGDTDILTVTITVMVARPLEFEPIVPGTYTFTPGQSIDATLPTATGGVPHYSYSLVQPVGVTDLITGEEVRLFRVINNLRGPEVNTGDHRGLRTLTGTVPADTAMDDSRFLEFAYKVRDQQTEVTITFPWTHLDSVPKLPESQTVSDYSYTVNRPITPLVLPAFTGGASSLDYSVSTVDTATSATLSTDLPAGLSFNATTQTISGTPTTTGNYAVTYKADESDGLDFGEATFNIIIADDAEPIAPTVENFSFVPGQVVSETLPPFTGGDVTASNPLIHRLTVGDPVPGNTDSVTSLEASLTYTPTTRTIAGTIPATSNPNGVGPTTYTYSATDSDDSDPETTSITFSITVVDLEPIAPTTSQDLTFAVAAEIDVQLNAFSGGTGGADMLTYALVATPDVPALPPGISFDQMSRRLRGTIMGTSASDMVPEATYTYTATDTDGDVASKTFTITVADSTPTFNNPGGTRNVTATQSKVVNELFASLTSLRGGNPPLSYDISPPLPAGLTFDFDRSVLEGIPARPMERTTYTYRVTDEDGNGESIMLDFTITILQNNVPEAPDPQAFTFYPGQDIGTITLDSFMGGDGTLTYALAANTTLPTGLTFNRNNSRALEGTVPADTPNDDSSSVTYTYTARDSDGDVVPATFTITIDDSITAPSMPAPYPFIQGVMARTVGPLPEFTTLDPGAVFTYSTTSDLPTGLILNSDRTISGTPTASGVTTHEYIATDAAGDSARVPLTIVVEVDSQPVVPNLQAFSYLPGAVVNETLPDFTGGNLGLTYSLTDGNNPVTDLVGDLVYDPNDRSITGTVTSTTEDDSARGTYTYSAEDVNGDVVSVAFTITITDTVPVAPTIENLSFEAGDVENVMLPVFTGGDTTPSTPLVYSLTLGSTPVTTFTGDFAGLTFTAGVGGADSTISGTIADTSGNEAVGATTFTYSATDNNGDITSVNFTITITDSMPHFTINGNDEFYIEFNNLRIGVPFSLTFDNPEEGSTLVYTNTDNPQSPRFDSQATRFPDHWLSFDSNTRTFSGIPVSDSQPYEPGIAVNNSAGETDVLFFLFSPVAPNNIPTPPSGATQDFSFTVGVQNSVTLAEFTGGDRVSRGAPLTYALGVGSTLPEGLSFNENGNRMITGTVTDSAGDQSGTVEYTYTATDVDGDTASKTFTITITDSIPSPPAVSNLEFVPGQDLTGNNAVTLLAFAGGDGTVTHSLTDGTSNNAGLLIFGLTFNGDSDPITLSGDIFDDTAMNDKVDPITFTYSATDTGGDQASTTFTIAVLDAQPIAPTVNDFTFATTDPVSTQLPLFGSSKTLVDPEMDFTYSLRDSTGEVTTLVGDLTFTPANRQISGTPNATAPATTYTYIATHGLDSDSTNFTIAIVDDPVPQAPHIQGFTFRVGDVLPSTGTGPDVVILPAFMGGNGALTHSLSDADGEISLTNPLMIGGLTYDTASRRISGTVMGDAATASYTYSATDTDADEMHDTTTITFTITIVDEMPVAPTATQELTFVADGTSQSVTLDAFTGGTRNMPSDELDYALADGTTLPTGLLFTSADRTIRSTITDNAGDDSAVATSYTYTATDADGDEVTATFTIAITDPRPQAPIPAETFTFSVGKTGINQAVAPFTGGNQPLSYAISSSSTPLPTGLTFNANTLTITGALSTTASTGSTTHSYTVTDQDGDVVTATFTIAITDEMPVAPIRTQALTFEVGVQKSETLEAFTGGTGGADMLTYALMETPMLPTGLSFDAATRVISGTVDGTDQDDNTMGTAPSYTYTATDTNNGSTPATFTITITDAIPSFGTETIDPIVTRQNSYYTSTALHEAATVGTGDLTYSFPSLPQGLRLDPTNRLLSGTPTVNAVAAPYTYTVTDQDGDTDTIPVMITIEEDAMPVAPTGTTQAFSFTVGQQSISETLTGFTGGDGTLIYSLMPTPALPLGLGFNASTLTISGNLRADSAGDENLNRSYTYRAIDQDGDSTPASFTIVVADPRPVPPTLTTSAYDFSINDPIEDIVLPAFTYSTSPAPPLTPSLSPALPSGLTFAVGSLTISGTPITVTAETTYTYSATDGTDIAQVTFTIEVADDATPIAPPRVDQTIAAGILANITLASFTGGDGVLTYTLLSPAPLQGLDFTAGVNGADSTIIGTVPDTPNDDSRTTTYTYTATDEDGDEASVTFTITVTDEGRPSFGERDITDISIIQNQSLEPITLPTVVTIAEGVTYSLTPSPLPTGLSFNENSRILMLAPTVFRDGEQYTYTATDADGETVSIMFFIAIAEDTVPVAPSGPQAFTYFVSNAAQTHEITLTAFTEGNMPLNYALEPIPALPNGFTSRVQRERRTIEVSIPAGDNTDNSVNEMNDDNTVSPLTYTYTATDLDDDEVETPFTIEVIDLIPVPPALDAPQSFNFTIGEDIGTEIELVAFTGGTGGADMLSYALSNPETFPTGLSFENDRNSSNFLKITGTPTGTSDPDGFTDRPYTYTATDQDGDVRSATFMVTLVDSIPMAPSIDAPLVFRVGVDEFFTLPGFTDSSNVVIPNLTYTLDSSPALPDGVEAGTAADFRIELSGTIVDTTDDQTSDEDNPAVTYTYTATDADGDVRPATFTIEIVDLIPEVPEQPQVFVFAPGQQSVSVTLEPFEGGNGAKTYALALTPELPMGLTIGTGANSRVIEGNIYADTSEPDNFPVTTYTYTATDSGGNGDSVPATFTIEVVDARPVAPPPISNISFRQGSDVPVTILPAFTTTVDGNTKDISIPTLTYSLTGPGDGSLPAGLMFNENGNRMITGRPSVLDTTLVTYTATEDGGMDMASTTFSIIVAEDAEPSAPTFTDDSFIFTPGQVVDITLPEFSGGDTPLTYSLARITEPAETSTTTLIGGLTFDSDADARTITGTVAGRADADDDEGPITYRYSVLDEDGDPAMVDFTIEIVDDQPSFGTAEIPAITAIAGVALELANPLPEVTRNSDGNPIGSGTVRYSIMPPLPASLSFQDDPDEDGFRELSGIAAATMSETSYTYTATDQDEETAPLPFTITVEEDLVPIAPATQDFTFTLGEDINTVTGVDMLAFSNSNADLTYELHSTSPALPAGLMLDSSTAALTGTPTVSDGVNGFEDRLYTYTATDNNNNSVIEDNNVVQSTFTITLIDPMPVPPTLLDRTIVYLVGSDVTESLAFTSGNRADGGSLTYSALSPALPDTLGLTFDVNTAMLNGTLPDDTDINDGIPADVNAPAPSYTFSATDADGDMVSTTFTIVVEDPIPVPPPRVDPIPLTLGVELTLGENGTAVALPPFTFNTTLSQNLTYRLGPLPRGTSFDSASQSIHGTPDEPGTTTAVYSAEDAAGDRATVMNVMIIVTEDQEPEAPTNLINPTFSQGVLNTVTLLPFSPGDAPLTYSLTLANGDPLPAWLTFQNDLTLDNPLQLSGIPPANTVGTTIMLTYTARDNEGTPDNIEDDDVIPTPLSITIEANTQPTAPTAPQDFTFAVGEDVDQTLLGFNNGNGLLTYTSPDEQDLMDDFGLEFNFDRLRLEGIVRGTAEIDTEREAVEYTYTATDKDGEMDSTTFTIAIGTDLIPMAPDTTPNFTFEIGQDASEVEDTEDSLAFTSGDRAAEPNDGLTYALASTSPALPTDLMLDPNTAALTGILTGTSDPDDLTDAEFTYTATDVDGDVRMATFTITIVDSIPMAPTDSQEFVFNVGDEATYTLAAFEDGDRTTPGAPLTYALMPTPALPDGIMMSTAADNRIVLSGTVADTTENDSMPMDSNDPAPTYTYTATDADGDVRPATFTIQVVDLIPVAPAPKTFTFSPGVSVDLEGNGTLPVFTGGNRAAPPNDGLTYAIVGTPVFPGDPGDITFSENPLGLTGTIPADTTADDDFSMTYSYTATDSSGNGDTATAIFTIVVEDSEPVVPTTPNDPFVFGPGDDVDPAGNGALVAFEEGDGTLTYALVGTPTPTLPGGLTFDMNRPGLSGTITPDTAADESDPMDENSAHEFMYIATDSSGNGDVANAAFTFTIQIIDSKPEAPTAPQSFVIPVGSQVRVTLQPFTGGNRAAPPNNDLTYAIDTNIRDLPQGLVLGADTNPLEISGIIMDTAGDDSVPIDENSSPPTYTYSATDAGGDIATATFTIQVIDARPVMQDIADRTFLVNAPEEYQLPEIATTVDGNTNNIPVPTLTYSVTRNDGNALGWLMFNPNSRVLSGTPPPGTTEPIDLTYTTSEDGGQDTASDIFTLRFTNNPMPQISRALVNQVLTPGQILSVEQDTAIELPPFIISTDTIDLVHSLSDDTNTDNNLAFNLTFDPNTLLITGTVPTNAVHGTSQEFTYSAMETGPNGDGDIGTETFTITINDEMPDFSTADPIPPINTVVNSPITEITLPTTTGTRTVRYTLTGANNVNLPDGLEFVENSGSEDPPALRGQPTEELPPTVFTYTATDEDEDTDDLMFTITVAAEIDLVTPTIDPIVFVVGQTAQNNVSKPLDLFTGGNGMLDYTLSNRQELMDDFGLMFEVDAQNRPTITGDIPADINGDQSIASMEFTYTATDDDNTPDFDRDDESADTTFTIQIVDPSPVAPVASTEVIPVEFNVGVANTEDLPDFRNNLPAGSDITPPTFTYTLTSAGTPPAWLNISADGRTLSGRPSQTTATPITLTYTATEDGGVDTASATVSLTVTDDPEPKAPTFENGGYTFTVGQSETINEILPEFDYTGPREQLSYQLNNAAGLPIDNDANRLVGGLMYDQNTRTISGPLGTDGGSETYTYIATDNEGTPNIAEGDDIVPTTFTITVIDEMPAFGTVTPPANIMGTQGTAIDTVTLPAVMTHGTGGSDSTTYSLTDPDGNAPTNGLTFDPVARTLSGIPNMGLPTTTYTYRATDADNDSVTAFSFTITIEATEPVALTAPAAQTLNFIVGQQRTGTLDPFTGGIGIKTYELNPSPALPDGLEMAENFATSREISGTIANTPEDQGGTTTHTYTATDEGGTPSSTTFTITVEDNFLFVPAVDNLIFPVMVQITPVTLPEFGNADSTTRYTLASAPAGLSLDDTTRVLSGMPTTVGDTLVTYVASTPSSTQGEDPETASTTFTISITGVPSLNAATASALPTVSANIALVASQAISSRVELALNGLSSGIDIRTLDGPSLRLDPQQQNGGSSGSSVRFGVWYSAASDSLSDTRSTVTWNGTTDSTNLGFDVGFDISESASLVVGILQNSSSTSATYSDTRAGSTGSGTLSIDLDSTAFYVGLGYDWLDAWFANGSADSTLNDSQIDMGIPASFSYQTIGLTASFEVADSFNIGGKLESLTSDLSLTEMSTMNFEGLQTDSSQLRTAFVANYQLKLGEKSNGLLVPKFEFGFRDLSLGTSSTEAAVAVGGSAMETGFGLDYFQKAWGLTVGLDIRSISVENYSSDSTQWQIRWESGSYGSGLSFNLTPHSVSETLGGIDSLYSGGYNQYQSVLERQRGGSTTTDSKGMDFEVGYGIAAGYGTFTPYLRTSNFRGVGNRGEEFGIRYQTLSGLELTLKAERNFTPQTIQILGFPFTFEQQENAFSFNTRYNF